MGSCGQHSDTFGVPVGRSSGQIDLLRSLWYLEGRESSPFAQSQEDFAAEQPQRPSYPFFLCFL